MATRDENLKKINDQLEMLSDEELENVAGGTAGETANDSRFLNVLLQGTNYHHCDRYGAAKIFVNYNGALDDVKKSWQSLGITLDSGSGCAVPNKYILNGKEISQKEAWAHAENLVGKHLTEKQWNW